MPKYKSTLRTMPIEIRLIDRRADIKSLLVSLARLNVMMTLQFLIIFILSTLQSAKIVEIDKDHRETLK